MTERYMIHAAVRGGGMFVQSIKFIEAHHGNKKKVSIYGQEYTNTTYKLAKMNLAIRGIAANLGEMAANTFTNDQHKDLKADYIMANPPFNQKEWRAADELTDDARWDGYEVPPTSNANYGWILNILVSKKFVSFKKPMNPSKFQTHPAVLELFALCAIPAVSLKGRKNTSANNA